ncbi:hypothetical protein MSPP1_003358 [Malassezia sp. CBS 17886]|nr:hypothetical protein MSPP1_003358 [Malassezia sp. CBS 17886]
MTGDTDAVIESRLRHFESEEEGGSIPRAPTGQGAGGGIPYTTPALPPLSGPSACGCTHLERATGWAALQSIAAVHSALVSSATLRPQSDAPLLGARDMAMLKQLVSVAFMWCVIPTVAQWDAAFLVVHPERLDPDAAGDAMLSDADADERAYAQATDALGQIAGVFAALFRTHGATSAASALPVSALAHTDVAVLTARVFLPDVVRVLLRAAYNPDGPHATAQTLLAEMLAALPTMQALAALRGATTRSALAKSTGARVAVPHFVRENAARLLSEQLLRPEGVRSLLIAMLGADERDLLRGDLGDEDGEGDATTQRLDGATKLLVTPPKGIPRAAYYERIFPALCAVLDPVAPAGATPVHGIHRRAAAFTVQRMWEKDMRTVDAGLRCVFAEPLGVSVSATGRDAGAPAGAQDDSALPAGGAAAAAAPPDRTDRALRLLCATVTLAPPSPPFIDALVAPVCLPLLALDTFLERSAQAPHGSVALETREVLRTWLRLASARSAAQALASAISASLQNRESAHARLPQWERTATGVAVHLRPGEALETSMLSQMPDALSLDALRMQLGVGGRARGTDAPMDADDVADAPLPLLGALAFLVDPERITALLRDAQRIDIARELLYLALDAYRRAHTQTHAHVGAADVSPAALERRAVYYLQLICTALQAFGSSILEADVGRVLHFIEFACAGAGGDAPGENGDDGTAAGAGDDGPRARRAGGSALDGLRSVSVPAHDGVEHARVAPDAELDVELVATALNLLLALLEGNAGLSPSTTPMLRVLQRRIQALRDAPDADIRALSQEAAVALAAREHLAATATAHERARAPYLDMYQEALTYLQDAILPVRAHGLHLLTELVSREPSQAADGPEAALDPALLPAIFDLFLEAVQDEESFLYLNAVKGLAAMAARWRDEVLRPLVAVYVGGSKTSAALVQSLRYGQQLSPRETDQRLRIGEALLQVLQSCGAALASTLGTVVEPLLTAVRNPLFSATLRSSFLSLLGTCVEVAPAVLVAHRWTEQLVQLCGELVAVEHVPQRRTVRAHVTARVRGRDAHGAETERALGPDDMSDGGEQRAMLEQDSGIETDPSLPQLRRAALLLLALLLRGTRHQLDDFLDAQQRDADDAMHTDTPLSALRMPGGAVLPSVGEQRAAAAQCPDPLVPASYPARLVPLLERVAASDTDGIVRTQAQDCVDEAQLLGATWAHVAAGTA